MNKEYSDYVVYVDESGDHGLISIDKEYPIFVLTFCIFERQRYQQTVNKIQQFKFKHFGHDVVILHEHEIRRNKGKFQMLHSKQLKQEFQDELTNIIDKEEFIVVSAIIDKNKLSKQYRNTKNPYYLAMEFCLERLHRFLSEYTKDNEITHVVFEQRGKQEDAELELEFRRVCDGNNYHGNTLNFDIVIASKQCNSTGLQLADLISRPIGINYLRPDQNNKAFNVIKTKFRLVNGGYKGCGLKIFP